MSTLLAEAIERLNLKPGQTYRTTIQGHEVEVRRLDAAPPARPPETPAPVGEIVMLEPWFELPDPPAQRIVRPTPGSMELPHPPIIPPDDETV